MAGRFTQPVRFLLLLLLVFYETKRKSVKVMRLMTSIHTSAVMLFIIYAICELFF